MRHIIHEEIVLPEGIGAHVRNGTLTCTKGSVSVSRKIYVPRLDVKIHEGKIVLHCEKGNKRDFAAIKTLEAHIRNLFAGLAEPYTYELEICNVHFPMTVKVEGHKLVITNFLGEKEKRIAHLSPAAHVEVKGQQIIITSPEVEAAGQTAANIEKATHITKRDRRIFQDGIFITSKCGRAI